MKEKDLIKRCIAELSDESFVLKTKFIYWKAPYFKTLRWDIFTIFDLIVIWAHGGIDFIQVTTTPNLAARRKKIQQYIKDTNVNIPRAKIYAWDYKNEVFKKENITQ